MQLKNFSVWKLGVGSGEEASEKTETTARKLGADKLEVQEEMF